MKKFLSFFLSALLCFSFSTTVFAYEHSIDVAILDSINSIPYTVPNTEVTNEMRNSRIAVLEKYPGLQIVAPASIDTSLPVYEIESMVELENFMSCLNSAPLYEAGYNVQFLITEYLKNLGESVDTMSSSYAILSTYGDAPAYHQENSTSINCYGYAADFDWWINPGDIYYTYGSPFTSGSTVEETAGWVIEDFWRADQRTIREISSASASITSTERRIALRVGDGYMNINGSLYLFSDYHFMRQTSTGYWGHKPGEAPSIYTTITNPSTASWDLYEWDPSTGDFNGVISGFYDSDVIYFAI